MPVTPALPIRSICAVLLVLMGACSDGAAPVAVPATLESVGGAPITAVVGTAPAATPTFVVRDAAGKTIGGIAVNVVIGEGGGTLKNAPTRSSSGATSVGTWTLGATAGRNTLSVTVGALAPVEIVATALAGSPTAIRVAGGDAQSALAGAEVAEALSVGVVDQFGNGVARQPVRFDRVAGGGTLTATSATTGEDGVAGGVRWTIGARGGAQVVRATSGAFAVDFSASVQSDFRIEVRFAGTPPAANVQSAFLAAADRIRAALVGDLPDISVQNLDVARCGAPAGSAISELIDDVIIFADVTTIDGVGKILGRAGPCYLRSGSQLALIGIMQFDEVDVQNLITSNRFDSVVLHEMLHVIGIGSLWRLKNLIDGAGTTDPRYNGAVGSARCGAIGFAAACTAGVPLENIGGSGTADVHWRESIFRRAYRLRLSGE
ncbi:MAG: Ig-like domain-containing protein [Gemmatimonadaceae bacterium]|nr:Ig-like domain-containing protein [Gemmatimonadaceae bacterium]